MHSNELVELGAIVAAHGPVLAKSQGQIPRSCIEDYWVASKCRLERWSYALRQFTDQPKPDEAQQTHAWRELRPVLEEILTGEVLTRVWTAVACAYDRHQEKSETEPIVRSVIPTTIPSG